MITIAFILLTAILVFAELLHKWSVAFFLVFAIPVVFGLDEKITFVCIIAISFLLGRDIRKKGKESIFVRFNAFHENNKLPRGCCVSILVMAVIVSIIKLYMLLANKW